MEDEGQDTTPAIRDTGQKYPALQLWHMGLVTKRPEEPEQPPQTTTEKSNWLRMASQNIK